MANNNSTVPTIDPEVIKAVISRLDQVSLEILTLHELIRDLEEVKPYHYNTILHSMTRTCAIDINNCIKKLGGDDSGYIESKLGTL